MSRNSPDSRRGRLSALGKLSARGSETDVENCNWLTTAKVSIESISVSEQAAIEILSLGENLPLGSDE